MQLSRDRWIVLGVFLIGLIIIGIGLYLGGSPFEARREARDAARADILETARYSVPEFYRNSQRLPTKEEFAGLYKQHHRAAFIAEYGLPDYREVNANAFELCSTFETDTLAKQDPTIGRIEPASIATPSSVGRFPGGYINFRDHKAEQTCWQFSDLAKSSPTGGYYLEPIITQVSSTQP